MLTSVLEITQDAAVQISQGGIKSYQRMRNVSAVTEYARNIKDEIKKQSQGSLRSSPK